MQKLSAGLLTAALVFLAGVSCQKELSCEDCLAKNQVPSAKAGPDQWVRLPTDSIILDGTAR